MTESSTQKFQKTVSEYLIRHKSILDCISKLNESASLVNRSIAKATTECGCIKIEAEKQTTPPDATLKELKDYAKSHLKGNLCPSCAENVEEEMGKTLFYLAALCVLLNLDMEKVITEEYKRVSTLGIYSLT